MQKRGEGWESSCQLSVVSSQLSVLSCQLSVVSCRFSAVRYRCRGGRDEASVGQPAPPTPTAGACTRWGDDAAYQTEAVGPAVMAGLETGGTADLEIGATLSAGDLRSLAAQLEAWIYARIMSASPDISSRWQR